MNTARRIAWFLVGLYVILGAAGLTLQAITGKPYVEQIGIPGLILSLILVGSWPVTGALVVSRHSRHPVGWLMFLGVIVGSIDMFAAGYAAYDTYVFSRSLPGADLALIWLTVGGMPFGIMAFTLATLPFPV